MTRPTVRILTMTLLVLGVARPAAAFVLTGTWTGTEKCKAFNNGSKVRFAAFVSAEVTQVGSAIGIAVHFPNGDTDRYTGLANPDARNSDRGEFAIIHCGTDDVIGSDTTFDEIGRMKASTRSGMMKARISGDTIFSDPESITPEAGSCKFRFTRNGTTDPGVSSVCP